MMTINRCILILLVASVFSGCESEETRQHHLYNLQTCRADTYAADGVAFEPTGDESTDKSLGYDRLENRQAAHDYRAADCMAHEEKTTLEYQRAKHDDYGRVCGVNETWVYDHCMPRAKH